MTQTEAAKGFDEALSIVDEINIAMAVAERYAIKYFNAGKSVEFVESLKAALFFEIRNKLRRGDNSAE